MSFTEIGNKAQDVINKVKESENNTKSVVLASAGTHLAASVYGGVMHVCALRLLAKLCAHISTPLLLHPCAALPCLKLP